MNPPMNPSTPTTPTQPGGQMPRGITIVLHEDKQCKGSVRYGTNDPEAPISSIYLSRKYAPQMPQTIVVTIASK